MHLQHIVEGWVSDELIVLQTSYFLQHEIEDYVTQKVGHAKVWNMQINSW